MVCHKKDAIFSIHVHAGGVRLVRLWCVNFQCRAVLLIWIIVGHGPNIALAVSASGSCLDMFSLIYLFSFLSPSLGDDPIQTQILSKRIR